MKLVTEHVCPPIPIRSADWQATTNNFDASYEEGRWVANEPIGSGATEDEAVTDLLEQLEDDEQYAEFVESVRRERGLS